MSDHSTTGLPFDGLGLRITHVDGRVELALSGELDLSNSAALADELGAAIDPLMQTEARPTRLTVDLQELSFIDSSGIQVLVAARRRCLQHGIDLDLRIGDSQVKRVLTLSGVAEFLGLD